MEEDGSQQRLVRNDQRKQQVDEDEFFARHRKARQCVAGRDRQKKAKGDREERGAAAVHEIGGQTGLIVPKFLIAFETEMMGKVVSGGIAAASDAVFSDAEIDRTSGANMTAQIAMQPALTRS